MASLQILNSFTNPVNIDVSGGYYTNENGLVGILRPENGPPYGAYKLEYKKVTKEIFERLFSNINRFQNPENSEWILDMLEPPYRHVGRKTNKDYYTVKEVFIKKYNDKEDAKQDVLNLIF